MNALSSYASTPSSTPPSTPPPSSASAPAPPPPPSFEEANAEHQLQLPPVIPLSRPPPVTPVYLLHIYIPVAHTDLLSFTNAMLRTVRSRCPSITFEKLSRHHISLSRPTMLEHRTFQTIYPLLYKSLTLVQQQTVHIGPIIRSFLNNDADCVYVAAMLSDTSFPVHLIRLIDHVFEQHNLPVFFDDPLPHMSFSTTKSLHAHQSLNAPSQIAIHPLSIPVKSLVCSIGTSTYPIQLAK